MVGEFSFWWGQDGWELDVARGLPDGDLKLMKLNRFDPGLVKRYPSFKDPAKEIHGPPEELWELFSLTNAKHARARCALWSHQFGWELRLTVNDSLIRSQVSRVFSDVISASDEWKAAMFAQGWQWWASDSYCPRC
jgi:hypothetical protein